jgi:hypothetical protein
MASKGNAAVTRKQAAPTVRAESDSPVTPTNGTEARAPQVVAIDRAFRDRAELRQGLTDNLRALRPAADTVADRVTAAFEGWNPSGLSRAELARRNFVAPGADPSDAVHRVIDRHVDALQDARSHARMTIRRRGRSGALVEDVTNGESGSTGTIKLGPLVDFVAERQDALYSFEALPAIATCKAEIEAAATIAEIVGTTPRRSGEGRKTDGKDDGGAIAVDELVERAVNRQMHSATAPEDRPVFEPIPTGARKDTAQAALLETFELRPGASDVPSYHEFNTLQIAFEHVWTQIFDGELESIGRELYKEYVGLKDFLGYDAPDTPITTIDDLRRLMAEIKELSEIAQAELPSSLGGDPTKEQPKTAGELGSLKPEDVILGATTGGVSLLVKWALDELRRAGQKPVLGWNDVDGGMLGRGDRITATVEDGVAPAGLVEFTLRTDTRSHRKLIAFQRYVEQAGKFVNVVFVGNTAAAGARIVSRNGQQYYEASSTFEAPLLPIGVFEFASQETETIDLGRYVLSDPGERLRERSRVIFTWTDN